MQSDPRRGLPSASSIERYFACNRSYLLERQVPDTERFENEDAQSGQRIHTANQTGDLSELESMKEEDLVRLIRQKEEQIFNQWCSDHEITDARLQREQRLWLSAKGVLRCSAQIDFYALSPSTNRCLVIDAKSGRKPVTPPVRNAQLRTAAVILAANYSIHHARVAIVQPLAKHQPQAEYAPEQIFAAWDQLEQLLDAIHNPDAVAVAGDHCQWCEAKHICPEAKSRMLQVSALEGLKWALQTPEQKVKLWDAWKLAQLIGTQIEQNIKADIAANPEAFKEWLVKKPDIPVRQVADVAGVYATMEKELNLDPKEFSPEFTKLCSMTVGDLKTLVRQKTGKGDKEADIWINRTLGAFITKKPRAGSVERVTK